MLLSKGAHHNRIVGVGELIFSLLVLRWALGVRHTIWICHRTALDSLGLILVYLQIVDVGIVSLLALGCH